MFEAGDLVVRARDQPRAIERAGGDGVERVDREARLARAGDAGDAREGAEGDGGGDVLQVVGAGAVVIAVLAVVYALCCRRGRVLFTRAGLVIEPSPQPRAPSESSPSERPTLQVTNPPPTQLPPRRNSVKRKAVEADPSDVQVATEATRPPTVPSSA